MEQVLNILQLRHQALSDARRYFGPVEEIAEINTERVIEAFRYYRVGDYHFHTSSGYGYGDSGRTKLDEVWAHICGAEKALVRTHFASGTHALATVLFGILRPGDELVSVTGAPYDTMQTVIGHAHPAAGSLKEYGITYKEVPLVDGQVSYALIKKTITEKTKMALIQRSRGYSMRHPLTVAQIADICRIIKEQNPSCICFVDNCYGEFVETTEPTAAGADIMAGSLIKNPGGGLAPAGGYIAGRKDLVELASYRLTAPGIGSEVGATLYDNRILFQGLFLAPHVVSQAVKGAIFAATLFTALGYETSPLPDEIRSDIIQAIILGSPEKMISFCQGLQKHSPVDAHVRPEPSPMPGYTDRVIMAGGTFVQGSSIELSADGPLRPPYAVYLQGGLTLEHNIIGITGAAASILNNTIGD